MFADGCGSTRGWNLRPTPATCGCGCGSTHGWNFGPAPASIEFKIHRYPHPRVQLPSLGAANAEGGRRLTGRRREGVGDPAARAPGTRPPPGACVFWGGDRKFGTILWFGRRAGRRGKAIRARLARFWGGNRICMKCFGRYVFYRKPPI